MYRIITLACILVLAVSVSSSVCAETAEHAGYRLAKVRGLPAYKTLLPGALRSTRSGTLPIRFDFSVSVPSLGGWLRSCSIRCESTV